MMNEQQRFLLKSNLKHISQDLLVDDVFSHLLSSFSIDQEDVELVKLQLTNRTKAEKLISLLLSKDKNCFHHFYEALKYSEYDHLAGLLNEGSVQHNGSSELPSDDDSLPDIETILCDGGVPQLPNVFVKRPTRSSELEKALYELKNSNGYVILHGMAGCGKTILATDVLRNDGLIHNCFPGGVFWVVVGNVGEMKLLMQMQNLCARLDPTNNRYPKNLEEAKDRLRYLFSHEHPRCLLILDDLWSERDIKYFDVRVRTLITTRYSAIADRLNTRKIKVSLPETLSIKQGRSIFAQWLSCDDSELPTEADLIIGECKGYPLAISMIGALLKSHKSRWQYYLSQLQEKKTSKVRSKLSYQYDSLYDAFAVSFESIPSDLQEKYKLLCIFEEDVAIPLDVLTVVWDLDEIECEDSMLELIERSLCQSGNTPYPSYSIHNIQLSFLKELANRDDKAVEYHQLLVDKYASSCNNKFSTLKNDNYVHWYFISHLLKGNRVAMAVKLCSNFYWLKVAAAYTTISAVIGSCNEVIDHVSNDDAFHSSLAILKDLCRFLRVYSHLISSQSVDLIQLAFCQPFSKDICDLAKKQALDKELFLSLHQSGKRSIYFEWKNRPNFTGCGVQLTSRLHTGSVNYCKYSCNSTIVASCGDDKSIRLWNSSTGEEILKLLGHTDVVNYCEFCHNDQYIISCSADKSIRIWSIENRKEIRSIEGHRDDITCCRCSPNGEYIVSGSLDKTVKVWNFHTGYLYCTLKEHTDIVNWCCFSHDSKLIASSSNDLTVNVWNFASEELCCVIGGDKDFIPFCMFTRDSTGILCTTLNFIQMFSVTDGMLLWCIEASSDVLSLDISPNEKYLAVTHNDMTAGLFDMHNKVFMNSYVGHNSWLNSASFSPDGRSIVTSSQDGLCKVWNVEHDSSNCGILTDYSDAVFTDDDAYVIVAVTTANKIRVMQSNGIISDSNAHPCRISCCVLSNDSDILAVGFADGNIKIMETVTTVTRSVLSKHTSEITLMQFNCRRLVSSSADNLCVVWCLVENLVLYVFNGHTDTITSCQFLSDTVISSSYDGTMVLWNAVSGDRIFTCSHDDNAVLSCSVSNNGKLILSCCADSKCRVWNAFNGTLNLTVDDHEDAVRCGAFSNDDSMFATGSDDGTVKVWNSESGDLICECEDHEGWVLDIKFNEYDDTIVTISNSIRWFDLNGEILQTFHISGNSLRFLRYTKQFHKFITIDNLGHLYILESLF